VRSHNKVCALFTKDKVRFAHAEQRTPSPIELRHLPCTFKLKTMGSHSHLACCASIAVLMPVYLHFLSLYWYSNVNVYYLSVSNEDNVDLAVWVSYINRSRLNAVKQSGNFSVEFFLPISVVRPFGPEVGGRFRRVGLIFCPTYS